MFPDSAQTFVHKGNILKSGFGKRQNDNIKYSQVTENQVGEESGTFREQR